MTALRRSRERCSGDPEAIRAALRDCGSGPLIVLLHGIAGDSTTREQIVPWLSPTNTVLAPDLLGHGMSCKPEGDHSRGAYANGLLDLLDALALGRGTIVGHSLGGGIAMQFADQFPER